MPLIFLVMTLFGECIQLKFSPNFYPRFTSWFSVLCSRMSFCTVVLVLYGTKPHVGLIGWFSPGSMTLVYSVTNVHSSIILSSLFHSIQALS